MSSISLLLFLAAASVQCIELIQSENIVVRPGESFTISCKFSGFSISSYCPNWIRQPAGKPLEHIGYVCSSSSSVKDSLKSKISFSADVSSSTVYLKGQNFQSEDSAVFYCARY
uniref:Immunoglobulin heavy variable 7-1 n=1 Tax=Astyanax mexicanus TaxID=7994 RepID=A0A3B1IMD7_ASTMX